MTLGPGTELGPYTSDESGRPEVYVQRFPLWAGKWRVFAPSIREGRVTLATGDADQGFEKPICGQHAHAVLHEVASAFQRELVRPGDLQPVAEVDERGVDPRLGDYQPFRSRPGTASKCWSRLSTASRCCSARAAIQASFAGIGRPVRLSATRSPA